MLDGSELDFVIQLNYPFGDLNIGFFYARPTSATIHMFSSLVELEKGCTNETVKFEAKPNKLEFPLDDQTLLMFLLYCGLTNGTMLGVDSVDTYDFVLRENKRHIVGIRARLQDTSGLITNHTVNCSTNNILSLIHI